MVELDKIKFVTIKYVTEEQELVYEAVRRVLPEQVAKSISLKNFSKMSVIGQYGDPMLLIELVINKKPKEVIKHIFSKLTETEKKRLLHEFNTRFDPETTTFFFRLDKFSPLKDDLYLNDGSDVIKVELKFKVYGKLDPEKIKEILQSLMGLEEDGI
ncbi:MAG: hypothetical protein D6732_08865 [Methanobacteriota archaeon]|nr:MAG: hypothetical protein D6732_08865 [Euryarchaeota archaeon]